MGKTCVICNRPSGMYPLCREHLQMKAAGEVIKCPDCGTWHLAKEKCPKCYNTQDENNDETSVYYVKTTARGSTSAGVAMQNITTNE